MGVLAASKKVLKIMVLSAVSGAAAGFFFYSANTMMFAPSPTSASIHGGPELGQGTEQLLYDLKKLGLDTSPTRDFVRQPLSTRGVMLTMMNDNVQVFEYPEEGTASLEGGGLARRYTTTIANSWKKQIHIYLKGTILVFYMGKNDSILTSLQTALGPQLN